MLYTIQIACHFWIQSNYFLISKIDRVMKKNNLFVLIVVLFSTTLFTSCSSDDDTKNDDNGIVNIDFGAEYWMVSRML